MITEGDYQPTFTGRWLCKGRKSKRKVFSDFISLDTETSHNHDAENPVGWIYQWALCIGNDTVVGRKPSELITTLNKIAEYIGADSKNVIFVYVHNLAYDMAYLYPFIKEAWGECKILAIANHKYISLAVGAFEFRCSYKLSNRSLEKWADDLKTEHRKLVGAIDYDSIHTQSEELTSIDWEYQLLDIYTLRDCVKKQMEIYGDTLATIPLTSTGYVRRECRKFFREDRKNRKRFLNSRINAEIYGMLRSAFSGGLTHGNRFYSEVTVVGNIAHRDFVSHYPSQQRTADFPVGKFNLYSRGGLSFEELDALERDYCYLAEILIRDCAIKSKDVVIPIISVSKMLSGKIGAIDYFADNGRVLEASGTFMLTVTELDLYWLRRLYDFGECYVGRVYVSKRGKLPKFMIDSVNRFFFGKCDIEEKVECEKDPLKKVELKIDLMKSKNSLNGIYGMSATQIVRESFTVTESGEWEKVKVDDVGKAIDDYYKSENSFMRYEWGVWTTANARAELLHYIYDIIIPNGGKFLYCDTDSAFYVTNEKVERAIEDENARLRAIADEQGYFIETESGKRYYRQFASEDSIEEFRFLHAKCYAYISGGELNCTIAGVSAFEDATLKFSREDELGEIDNLKHGFVFRRCGGVTVKYDDTREIGTYVYNGEEIECATSCIISKGTKTLSNESTLYDEWKGWCIDD